MNSPHVHTASSTFERVVTLTPAYDKRATDPKKNYGIHGVELRMVLKGEKGATQFLLFTNWHLPSVDKGGWPLHMLEPLPADLGYHWSTPRYEGHGAMKCGLMPSGECYYDGSGLNADRIYQVLLREGSEGVWRELETYYNALLSDETRDGGQS